MKRKSYPSNLTDAEWAVIQRYFPRIRKIGRPPTHSKLVKIKDWVHPLVNK